MRSAAGYRLYGEEHLGEVAFIRQMQDLGFYADQVKEFRRLATSDQADADREKLFAAVYDRHVEYLKQKAERYSALYERCVEASERKRFEIVGW